MSDSIFTKIKNQEIPGNIIYEDDQCFAIEDINPQAPVHILIINNGAGAGQSVFHIHVHLMGGRSLEWPPG